MATKITTPELFNLQSNNIEGTQLPVMTRAERIAMTGMSNGELIFNSTTDSVEYYDAGAATWYKIDSSNFYPADLKIYLNANDTASYPGTGTTWFDLTSNENNGAISNASWNSGGYFNFTTNDYIDLTGNTPYSSSTTQTNTIKCVTGWIKPDTGSSRVYPYSVASTTTNADFFQIGWFNDLDFFRVNIRNGTSAQSSNKQVAITPTTDWVHFVVQLTKTTTEIYLNGNSQTVTFTNTGSASNTSWISFPTYATSVRHTIGRSRYVTPGWSDGSISKVRHYDRVLTQAEITALYNETWQ